MIKQLAISCMLVGAITPYKEMTQFGQQAIINLPSSNKWVETENITLRRYEKTQILKAETYENSLLKLEQIKFAYFSQQTGRQHIESYLFTRITPKIQINEISYYTNGNTQTYIDAQGITENPTYGYEFWRLTQNSNNQQEIDIIFNMQTYDSAYIVAAYDQMTEGYDINREDTIDALQLYGNDETNYTLGSDVIVLMEYVYMSNAYTPNPEFEDRIFWDRQYQFFYGQPYRTTINYNWYVDPDEVDGYEVIDLGNLLLTVLGMPMAWITQAFNFTLWPGTPYALNVGHILSAVIIASIVIIILKKVYR